MSHATRCHVQLVLCNYTNLQLHMSHAIEFLLQKTIAKPKFFSNDSCRKPHCTLYLINVGLHQPLRTSIPYKFGTTLPIGM